MIWPYAAAGALIAGFLTGWTVRDWKADSAALHAEQKADALHDKLEANLSASATAYEQFAAGNRDAVATDRRTIREIYRNVEVPADCAVPVAGVGLLDHARDSANAAATGGPGGAMPESGAAAGADD